MKCTCPVQLALVQSWGVTICMGCGISHRSPIQMIPPAYDSIGPPVRAPYSRAKRFARILSNAFGQRTPKVHSDLIKSIEACECRSPEDIYRLIRRAKPRNHKRYDSLAYLSFNLTDTPIRPLTQGEFGWCIKQFQLVLERFIKVRGTFPAYSYIVERCLLALRRDDLLRFVHKLKCKRRRRVYSGAYGDIFYHP